VEPRPGSFGAQADGALFRAVDEEDNEIRKSYMAKAGSLNIPPLLEQRRWEYAIPDGAFSIQASFDRILAWQIKPAIHDNQKGTFGDTSIIMPAASRDRTEDEAPRAILVSAGLNALDNLRSNGIDIGHIVTFVRLAPWGIPVVSIGGKEKKILILRDGDILGSEDLKANLDSSKCGLDILTHEDGSKEHRYVDQNGTTWDPTMPNIDPEY